MTNDVSYSDLFKQFEQLVAAANQIVNELGFNGRHALFIEQVKRANSLLDRFEVAGYIDEDFDDDDPK